MYVSVLRDADVCWIRGGGAWSLKSFRLRLIGFYETLAGPFVPTSLRITRPRSLDSPAFPSRLFPFQPVKKLSNHAVVSSHPTFRHYLDRVSILSTVQVDGPAAALFPADSAGVHFCFNARQRVAHVWC
jgi:hypothetical protein